MSCSSLKLSGLKHFGLSNFRSGMVEESKTGISSRIFCFPGQNNEKEKRNTGFKATF
jgi:hypothetical protein